MTTDPDDPLFDVAILGAGVAGLCLAHEFLRSDPPRTVLLVDGAPDEVHRAISFWSMEETPHEPLVRHAWRALAMVDAGGEVTRVPLAAYRYRTMLVGDLHREVTARLEREPGHRVVQGRAGAITSHDDTVSFEVGGRSHRARWVFDSRFHPDGLRVDGRHWHLLWQRFHGWTVRTATDVFDPSTVVFLDFRADPRDPGVSFFHVLPFGPREALVEFVSLGHVDAPAALESYLRDVLHVGEVEVIAREAGVSPLTEQPFAVRMAPRVRAIGIPAGRLKASTGYAFTRIVADSRAIVRSLDEHGHPFHVPSERRLFRWLDGVFLELSSRTPRTLPRAFRALFRRNPGDRVLRFLDEQASWWDLVRLVATLPVWPFVRAAVRWLLRRIGARRDTGVTER